MSLLANPIPAPRPSYPALKVVRSFAMSAVDMSFAVHPPSVRQSYSASTISHRSSHDALEARRGPDAVLPEAASGPTPSYLPFTGIENVSVSTATTTTNSMSSSLETGMFSGAANSCTESMHTLPPTPAESQPKTSLEPHTTSRVEHVEQPLAPDTQKHQSPTRVDHSWDWSVPIPGNLHSKKLFPNAKVELPNCTESEYNNKFKFLASHLEKAINNRPDLRDDTKLRKSTSYSAGMVGESRETAKPSIVVYCLKGYFKKLRSVFNELVQEKLYCPKDSLPRRLFSRYKVNGSQAAPFDLVYYCTDLNPVNRKAADAPLMAHFDTDRTWCGGVIQSGSRMASLGLTIETDDFVGVLTVDHLFPPQSRSKGPGLGDTPRAWSDTSNQSEASTFNEEDMESLGDLWSDSGDEYCLDDEESTVSQDQYCLSGEEPLAHDTLPAPSPAGIDFQAQEEWERILPCAPLDGSESYMDWAVTRPTERDSLQARAPRENMFFPKGRDHAPVLLNKIAPKPRCHLAGVYMVSGIRGVLPGRLLGSSSMLGSGPGQDLCEVWTVILDGGKNFVDGECGSAVIDQVTNRVYGHVVACGPLGQAYVVPLRHVLDQVKAWFKATRARLFKPPRAVKFPREVSSPRPISSQREVSPPQPVKAVTWPRPQSILTDIASEEQERAAADHKSHQIPTPGVHEGGFGGPRSRSNARAQTYTDENDAADGKFPRISRPVELLRGSYDCVVIGSGYGGGVAASRMARAGETVCLLERGKEKWPGEYPTGTKSATEELHFSGTLQPGSYFDGVPVDAGDPTGMYHVVFGKGQNAVVCNGLGGTSLMNANVFMEANHDTLEMTAWPEEIRKDPKSLDRYYAKAREVLDPQPYPSDWPKLPKLELLKKQAEYLGMADKFRRVDQTTRFRNGPNSCGVEMLPSSLTGQDPTGVNDGSKTTTLVTYLADAWNWGAEMFCECEVRYIEKCTKRDGYNVYFAWHGRNRGLFKANLHGDLMWVHAKKAVFLGAGAIGTTEILLRSKELGLSMSDQVGQNMSGNGDMLAFGYNTDETVNGVGRPSPSPYNPVGPCINGVIDNRDGHANPLDGYVIEEGTIPEALAPLFQVMADLLPDSISSDESLTSKAHAQLARWGSRILGPYYKKGAVERTQVYLIMSHDSNQAVLSLHHDKPVLEFLGVGRSDHVKKLNNVLARATRAVGGTLVQNPFFALMGEQEVTVHPIGGACMSRDGTPSTGVVDHFGEVFKNGRDSDSKATHEGLIVTDAAAIPAALGANPFATITALAERSVEAYCKKRGLHVETDKNDILDLFGEPKHHPKRRSMKTSTDRAISRHELDSVNGIAHVIHSADATKSSGFGFTEVMSGFIHYDEEGMKEDKRSVYELAYRTAENHCESARFFLSVQAFDTKYIVSDKQHKGLLTGTFVCPTVPGSPFMVQRGEFNLFKLDLKAPGTRNLTYDFDMTGVNGELLHFHGYKVVDSSVALAPLQFWRSTSTLYVTISKHGTKSLDPIDAHDEDAWRRLPVVAKGVMHIYAKDFVSEVMTLTPTGSSLLQKAMSAASFMTFFTRKSLNLFLGPFTSLQYPSAAYGGYINNTLPDKSFDIWSVDDVCTKMHMWNATSPPSDGSPVQDLFMIPGASVDHQIYALPTIPYNAVNYFTRAGYRVFVTVHRIGLLMTAENEWTTYDARLDIKACLKQIRELRKLEYGKEKNLSPEALAESAYQPPKTYCITHCMGSVAFASGLLDGTIPSSWVKGASCSQVFMNPIWNTLNMIKASEGPLPLDKVYGMLAGSWFSCSTSRDDTLVQRGLNQLLRFLPDARREICNSASCHRVSLTFGRCWNHRNLNEATHRQIDRFFGGVNMRLLHLLMKMGLDGHVMTNGPLFERLTTGENIARLRGVPVLLFVGGDNAVLSPESTERTYEILCDTFGTRADVGAGISGNNTGKGPDDFGVVNYRRRVIPGYGHLDCWMGRNAWKDVYPLVREEVDRVCHGEKYTFKEPEDRFKQMVDSGELQ